LRPTSPHTIRLGAVCGAQGLKVVSEPKARNIVICAQGQGMQMDGWGAICPYPYCASVSTVEGTIQRWKPLCLHESTICDVKVHAKRLGNLESERF
jgi:hypothetical protein